jgi:CRISPR-associated protein Cas2
MQVVVAYDISDDRRRNRVAACLRGYGERVNFSVFECVLKPASFSRLKRELKDLIRHDEDSIRIYQICGECVKKTEVMGWGPRGFESGPLVYA